MGRLRRGLIRGWSFFVSEDGPSATEYAILLALLVLVAVGAIRGIGERMINIYENIHCAIPTV